MLDVIFDTKWRAPKCWEVAPESVEHERFDFDLGALPACHESDYWSFLTTDHNCQFSQAGLPILKKPLLIGFRGYGGSNLLQDFHNKYQGL